MARTLGVAALGVLNNAKPGYFGLLTCMRKTQCVRLFDTVAGH